MGKSNSFLVLLAVVSVLWGPVLSEKCAIACKGAATSPSFLNGHKYNYGLEGTVTVLLSGADKQETSVKLLGQVTVTALGNCGHELRVQNLVISGPDGKKYGSPSGIEKPIIFSLQDGRLGSEICAEEGDSRRSLNIKRAIVSLLQSEEKPSSQVDIFGVCPTEASSSQEGGALLVHRSRDLSRCAHREQGRNDLISAVYNPTAEIKSTQVLQSSLHVESKVLQGIPEKVSATEDYLYKPFSVGQNGARAKVHTRLTLTGKAAGAAAASACTDSRTVIFENPHGGSNIDNAASIVSTVKDTAKTLSAEASSQSAGIFAQLIRIVRAGNKEALLKAYNQVRGNPLEKRVFLDALLRAGSGDSVEASIDILKKKELSPLEQNLVLLSLGNARHVDNEALKAAASLLDLPNLPREVYLGVGALAGTFCRDHSCHHVSNDGIKALSQKLGAKLNCKAGTKTAEDLTIAVLKGIRSIRHLEDSLIDKLVSCAADNSVKARVRVAALEAFHADPCSAKLKKTALDLLKNRQLDSEIRINAYLAVIQCPCGKSANEIKTLLDSEPVHQVGRFISSSLRHIRSSANPDKQLAKQHYGQIRTPNKFNIDDRKYSFYREASYNIDALGLGGSIEESVIYSQDSFIPRSVNFNLTAELFGHNLNIFEVGARQGNLDRVVEHFLGPRSFLRREEPQEIYDKFMQKLKDAQAKVETLSRGRRSIKTEVDNFDKHLKAESEPYNNELDLDVYLKLFGTDAVFLSLGDDKGFDYNSLLDEIVKVLAGGFNKAKHFQQELRANLLFLDAELSYPTSVGLPLKLDLIGSATGRLDVATNVDVRQILKNPESAKVDIKLVPSTDIEIAGLLLIDADAVITGLKVITNLHSSTGGHLIAKVLENGRGIDIQFGLPIEKQEILTASNDLVFVTAEKGQKAKLLPLKTDAENKHYSGCFDQLSGLLGLTLCGEVSVPFSVSGSEAESSISKFLARYPLSGSSKLSLVLEKNDLRGYHIKALAKTENQRSTVELLFEAEGSKNRRTQISGELVNRDDERSIKVSLDSPIKVLYGEAVYIRKPSELSVHVKGKIDKAEYYARAGFNVQGNEKRSVFKPVLEYQLPEHGKQSLKVDGQLIKEVNPPETKYSLEGIKITIPNSNEVVNIQGHLKTLSNGAEIDLKAQKGEQNLAVVGSLKGHDVKLDFKNTLNPYINFKANGHVEFGETVHNDLEVFYGGECKDPKNKFSFNQLLKYHGKSSEDFGLITKNKLEVNAVPLIVKVNAEADPKKLSIDLDGQYADKKASVDLDARTQIKKPGDYSVKVAGNIEEASGKRGIEILSKREIVSPDKSNFENYVLIKNYGKYELSGVVNHKNKPNDVNVGAVGSLKFNGGGKSEEISIDVGLTNNNNQYSNHAKVASTKGVILDYLLKVSRGANPNGQLKFILKDTVSANGQYKVTDGDGKGNGAIIVDFKKSQRKIKADVKFVAKEPVFNADIDVFLNFEKDNNDKIRLSTANKRTEKLVESKNKLEYGGKKTEVNVHHEGRLDAVGKQNALVEIILPTERCLSLKVERELNKNGDNLNGHADVVLSDAPKKGAQASTITYKAKLGDTNLDKNILNYDGQLELKLKDGKQLINSFSLKHVPEGEKFKFDFKSDVSGNLIPKPASLVSSAVYMDSILNADDSYRVKASYGDNLGFELIGSEVTQFAEKGDKKYKEDYSVNIRLPFEKAHDIKLASSVLFLIPENAQSAEFTIIESVQINADLYKVDASGKLGKKAGNSKLKVQVPHNDPFVLEVNYKGDYQSEKKSGNVEIKTQYGKGKSAIVNIDAASVPGDYNLKVRANAPQAEKLKKLELSLHTKKPSADTYSSSLLLDADGKIYKYDSLVVYSKSHPVVDLKFSCPENKPGRIYYKGDYLSPSQGKGELKIENVRDFSIDATSEAEITDQNVVLKAAATSEKLGLKNFKLEISSKDAANGKRLEIATSNDNKNILSGSTSFIRKQEGLKLIMEGSGSVKVKEQQKAANFKYIRTLLTEGNEQGVETFLNLAVDERSYVAEYRYTNLEYKSSYVYCEEKKQCAHMELGSKISSPSSGVYQHLLKVDVDLRKLGFAPEFGLQVSNEASLKKLPQYTLDLHVNKEEKKYYIHAYSQPDHGKFPAGITITLPTRVLAAETLVVYPADKDLPFPIKAEISLYPDKNKPNTKTGARILVDLTGDKTKHVALAEFGFSHPKIGKEALVKFRGNVLRPDEKSIKIETSATFSYPPAGSDRVSQILFEVNPSKFKLLVSTPIVQVISIEGGAVVKENLQSADVKFSLLGGNAVQVKATAKDYQYYEFTTRYTDQSDRKLSITAHVDPEKRVDVSADIILADQKKNIVHGALFLQDNLVKTDYGASKDNFNYFVTALKNDLTALESRIKAIGEKASEEFKTSLSKLQPNLKKLEQAYSEDLEKLYQEVSNDKVLKEISKALNDVIQYVSKLIQEVSHATKPIVDKISATLQDLCQKIKDMYEKQLEPQLKQLYTNVAAIIKEYFEGLLDVVAHFAALATDFYEKHKPEIQELVDTFTEIFKDLTRLIVAQLKELRAKLSHLITNFSKQFHESIDQLPVVGMLKEKLAEFSVPEQLTAALEDGYKVIVDLLPTSETKDFTYGLIKYVQKKLNKQKVDDAAELRIIYEKLVAAINSVFRLTRDALNSVGVPAFFSSGSLPFISSLPQGTLPTFGGPPSFSVINQLLRGDLIDPISVIKAYRPRSLNPLDEIPAKLRAVVVNGQHIFTFDGRHLTFPGSCRYVLAHDHVDRNFTLILQLQNGSPKSLVLEDKSGVTIELKENGQVAVNGAAHGFPVMEKESFAFKQTNGRIGLGSLYGIMAFCTGKLEVCYIEVSGFYLGKLRGLLGDGNNEPFDDFRLPNGKISPSESEFGNAYRLASSCAQVKVPEHSHHQMHQALPKACEQVFGASSPLRPLALVLDAAPFRQACVHAVSADSANALHQACDLARGYAALAVSGLLPAVLPPVCVQCTDAGQPKNVGDVYEVKLPNKLADIVVAVETTKSNEKNYKDLVVPLVSQLVDSLKAKHITDIKVYLVGITSKIPYPIVYDTDLKLKNPKVQFTDESRYKTYKPVRTNIEKVDKASQVIVDIVHDLRIKLGLTNVIAGYSSLIELPLRPGAVKHTIGVVGEKCRNQFALLEFLRVVAYDSIYEQNALTNTLIALTPDLKIGAGKDPKQIVGFSEDSVLLLGDKKKSKDSESLRATLDLGQEDACIDFIEETDGLILSASNFHALNPGQQKQYLQTAASAISARLLQDSIVQECVCSYVDPFRVRSVCSNKERKAAPARRRK